MTLGKSALSQSVYGKDFILDTFAKVGEKNNAEAAYMPIYERLASAVVSGDLC